MPSTSKSNQRKRNRERQVKKPTRNWLELPSEVLINILYRVGAFDILENAQKVCTAWLKICKDPFMWKVIYMDKFLSPNGRSRFMNMHKSFALCKHAVDRSKGQLIDVTIVFIGYDDFLLYVARGSRQLRRLEIAHCYRYMYRGWTKTLKKFPLLEELGLYTTEISKEGIETAARYCPVLKTLKVNQKVYISSDVAVSEDIVAQRNEIAIGIGENLHELEHLELIGSKMTNTGLEAILDGCCRLKSLDLRGCFYIDLEGELGKRCSEQIKCLKLPDDSLEGCPYIDEKDR